MKYNTDDKLALNNALGACLVVQRTYGKQGADLDAAIKIFLSVLEGYSMDKIVTAVTMWLKRSPEFPTPSDIITMLELIPPDDEVIQKHRYAALIVRRKAGQWLNPQEEAFIKKYEAKA